MQSITGWKSNNIIFFILLISYCFSYIGYSELLHILYPIIGWVSIVLLPIIAFKQSQKHKESIHFIGCFLYVHSQSSHISQYGPISNAKYGFNCNRIIRLGMRSKTNWIPSSSSSNSTFEIAILCIVEIEFHLYIKWFSPHHIH